jgi:asparagine synthetase B (glutamine-hydrolysing)
MANSVEVRCPFLDRHVAEFAAQLPVSQKMNLWKNKTIVRNSMRESIPPSAYQSRKQGFNAPLLSRAEVNLPKDPRFVREYWFHPGKEDVTFKQNNLLVLNLWFDMFSNYKNTGCWEPTSYGC